MEMLERQLRVGYHGGEHPATDLVLEIARRVYNPVNRLVNGDLFKFLCEGVYDLDPAAAHVSGSFEAGNETVTDEFVIEQLIPRLICDGFAAGFVGRTASGITTVNKEKRPAYCRTRDLPSGTIDQLNIAAEKNSEAHILLVEGLPDGLKKGQTFVHAGYAFAKLAYGNKTRANGDLYINHPLRAAAILSYLIDIARSEGLKISEREEAVAIFGELGHDSLEEAARTSKYYIKGADEKALTPLLVRTLGEELGMGSLSMYLANAIRLMTHDRRGWWMQSYKEYMYRLAGSWIAALDKPVGDILDNLTLDPKPMPKKKSPDETDERLAERIVERDEHRGEYYHFLYEDGMRKIPYAKNAYHNDSRMIRWAGRVYDLAGTLAYPDETPSTVVFDIARRKAPMGGAQFRRERMPQIMNDFSRKFELNLAA